MRKNQRERDDEASSSEEDGEEEERVSNAQRGRVRLHGVVQSSTGLGVDDDRRKSLGEKGWARRSVVVRALYSGAEWRSCLRGSAWARGVRGAGEDGAAEWEKIMLEFAEDNFNDAGIEVRTRRAVERQRARWHDPVLRRCAWAHAQAATALCLREKGQRARRSRAGGHRGARAVPAQKKRFSKET